VKHRTLEKLLLKLSLGDLDLDGLVNLLGMSLLVIGVVLDRGGEERVDESSLAQARLASNLAPPLILYSRINIRFAYHYRKSGTALCDDLVSGLRSEVGT
jgi:hypothetical protein